MHKNRFARVILTVEKYAIAKKEALQATDEVVRLKTEIEKLLGHQIGSTRPVSKKRNKMRHKPAGAPRVIRATVSKADDRLQGFIIDRLKKGPATLHDLTRGGLPVLVEPKRMKRVLGFLANEGLVKQIKESRKAKNKQKYTVQVWVRT